MGSDPPQVNCAPPALRSGALPPLPRARLVLIKRLNLFSDE